MGKLNNTIKMLLMLKSNKLISRVQIAENLGVNVKEVSAYKEALDECFDIETVKGRYGGYKLRDTYFPFKSVLTEREVVDLRILIDKLEYSEDDNEKFKKVIDKINFSILNSDNFSSGDIIPYSKRNKEVYNEEIEFKIYKGTFEKVELIIEYLNNNNEASERHVRPYEYFSYRGENYLVAYCCQKKEIRYFKFIRIKSCIVTSKKFQKEIEIEEDIKKKKEKGFGIYDVTEYDLEIEISPPMSNSIRERIWVDNQEITELENGKILFKAQMKGEHSILSWILTMRQFAKIRKPEELRLKVIEEMEKMIENHKN
ncbi:MAG: helix-turn-helix transcriptional regulator [Clostridium sp.]|uniref:helix-turn-helix transcriptional regulator n=1 Tax=Clostridium sp. TaxID=1506 RepID=UPI003F32D5D6